MFKLRDYQVDIIKKGTEILNEKRFLYLAMEVRCGKTLTSLGIAGCNKSIEKVLFLTKKKAISSIEHDYKLLNPSYNLKVINYESIHKIEPKNWDLIILDEAHSMGAFPKPSKRAKQVKELLGKCKPFVILLSGTPTPESFSQMYHQVYGIKGNPFQNYTSFYKFAHEFVDVKMQFINGFQIKNYKEGKESIIDLMQPYTINFTQKQSGFESSIEEEIIEVKMKPETYQLCNRLKKDLVVQGENEVILADTGVKLMGKLHQLYSGTVKFESGNSMIVDFSKAEWIRDNFKNKKIGIFYKFTAELKALQEILGDDLTTDLTEFNNTDKKIALQIVSGREGISLRNAEFIVFYNIDFSATSYWQARDRMTTKERKFNKVFWLFSKKGIEKSIYKAVSKKKNFTLKHFKNDRTTDTI